MFNSTERSMSHEHLFPHVETPTKFRLCNVSGYATELLELRADDPKFHVLFIPGNPGVVFFYKDFLESLFEFLGGAASITAIGHTGHTKKNWHRGRLFSLKEQIDHKELSVELKNHLNPRITRLFSLKEQIDHKVDFIRQELQNIDVPIILVGHSIGSYIAIEMLRRSREKVIYCIVLYPFLMFHPQSSYQLILKNISESTVLSAAVSFLIASFSFLPKFASRLIVLKSLGRLWSTTAVDAVCSHLLQYHTLRNILFMTKTEFLELAVEPDWAFMRENREKLGFLFGVKDHWGPLEMFNDISKQVPGITISMEREGHAHNFSCTKAGSMWVAQHVASLIKTRISRLEQDISPFQQSQ